jgi:hypothetical protein
MTQPPYDPQMGPMTTRFAKLDPGPNDRFGVVGGSLAVVGAVLAVIAFLAVNWFDDGGRSHFSDTHRAVQALDDAGAANGLAVAFFGWLAWVSLIIVLVVALLANVPNPLVGALRGIGFVLGLGGAALTFASIKLSSGTLQGDTTTYGDYLKHAGTGFWLTVAGFVVMGIGALIGPRRA